MSDLIECQECADAWKDNPDALCYSCDGGRQQKIHAIVSKWDDDERIPVSFDDWQPVVIEQNDLEGWVQFNIFDYLEWCIGMDLFSAEEVAISKVILQEVKEVMS